MSNLPPPPPPPPATGGPSPSPTADDVAVCYRHPNRPTGRVCTRCGRPACPDCLRQASVGSHCLECVKAAQPAGAEKVRRWAAGNLDIATRGLIAVNVAVFVVGVVMSKGNALLGDTLTTLHRQGALFAPSFRIGGHDYRGVADGGYWRLVTSGFLHLGLLHVGLNMWALRNLGPTVERLLGTRKFLLVYFASLVGGSAGALLVSPNVPTVGASGAIFGLFGLLAATLHRQGVNPFRTSIGTFLLLNLAITFTIPGISIGGHLGGLAVGAICGYAMTGHGRKTPTWTTAVPVGLIVVAVAVATFAARR